MSKKLKSVFNSLKNCFTPPGIAADSAAFEDRAPQYQANGLLLHRTPEPQYQRSGLLLRDLGG